MAEDLVVSGIKIDTVALLTGQRKIEAALTQIERRVGGVDRAVAKSGRGFSALGGRIATLAAGYISFRAAVGIGREFFRTNAELQDLNANLVTVTGSAGKASQVFREITTFARETPFEIKGLTEAFVRLQAFGAGPTIDQFRGLGNISAAFSRDITTLSDAMVSAVNTSIEPIRQFGVQASISGDSMRVSFGGVTKTIPRTTAALSEFLAEMGNTGTFVGAMDRRMKTLGGSMSNLSDVVTIFSKDVGDQGLNAELVETIQLLTKTIQESDDLARTIGQGAAGGVRLFREALLLAIPVMRTFADLLAAIGDQGSRVAAPELAAIANIDDLDVLEQRRRMLDDQLQAERGLLDEMNAATRGGLAGFADRVGFFDVFGGQNPDEELAAQAAEVDGLIEALGALDDKRRELIDAANAPATSPANLLNVGDDKGKKKDDPIGDALKRLEEDLRGIEALRDALSGTSIEFDANAEAAQAYQSALEAVARVEGVSASLVAELAGNYAGLTQTVKNAQKAEEARAAMLEAHRANAERHAEFLAGIAQRQAEMADELAQEEIRRQRDVAESITASFGDAFASIITGTQSVSEAFRQMAQEIIAALIRIQIERAILEPLIAAMFPATIGPIDLGGPGGGLPGFASGGHLSAGRAAIVGERGPELFVPSTSGSVVPRNRMGGGGPAKIENHFHSTYEIRAIDTRDLVQAVDQIAPAIARNTAREVERSAAMRRRFTRS